MDPDLVDNSDAGSKKAPAKEAKAGDSNAIQLATLQTFLAVIVFFPFIDRSWFPYATALTGYSVLVFSLVFRDAECSLRKPEVRRKLPGILLLHTPFLASVYVIVMFSIRFAPQLPRFMTQSGRKGSLFDWAVTFALVMLAWAQELWMRKIIRSGLGDGDRLKEEA
jgi:hypothetical protein